MQVPYIYSASKYCCNRNFIDQERTATTAWKPENRGLIDRAEPRKPSPTSAVIRKSLSLQHKVPLEVG